jgi:glutamate dehydrogenase
MERPTRQSVLHDPLRVPRRPRSTPDDLEALERRIAAATRAWVDDLRDALVGARGEEDGLEVLHQWGEAFPAAYRDFGGDEEAATAASLAHLERLLAEVVPPSNVAVRPEALRQPVTASSR